MPERTPVVAVPARDEAQRLPALVEALARQTWLRSAERSLRIVLVLNNCTDGSRDAALGAVARHPGLRLELVDVRLPPATAHVGTARRLAFERAVRHEDDPSRLLLLTTDADAVPAPDWVEANLSAAADGADLVGGLISGDRGEEARLGPGFGRRAAAMLGYAGLADRLASLVDPLPHDPWPRHRDHTGASLAVRGEVYRAVGGLPAMPRREDLAFVSRVRAAGYRLRHALDVRVEVSARLVGRAPGGMADCLKDWMRAEAEGRPLLVEAPDAVERRLLRRRRLRDLDGADGAERRRIAAELDLDPASIAGRSAAALVERFAPDEPDAAATVPVEAASALIRAMIASWEGQPRAA